jgi:two-component system sensor histidine kinase KdpD
VYDLGQIAGLGTDTLSFSEALYVPLLASQGTIGVLRLHPIQSKQLFTPEQMRLLEASAHQIALALEVDRLQEQEKKSELQTQTDHAKNALLQSISRDLRTPLLAALGDASTLQEMGDELEPNKIKKLGNNISIELEQLNRLINNLLQMTYLEDETVKLQKELYPLDVVINSALEAIKTQLGKKPIHLQLPENMPQIPMDKTLLQEVFINLIDNAIKFTPAKTPIDITAQVEKDKVVVNVADRGPGIVADEVDKLFEKFYRGRMITTQRGMGLGLAICSRIIKAHGGEIWAENRPEGGAVFRFTLPLVSS